MSTYKCIHAVAVCIITTFNKYCNSFVIDLIYDTRLFARTQGLTKL